MEWTVATIMQQLCKRSCTYCKCVLYQQRDTVGLMCQFTWPERVLPAAPLR